MEAVNTLIQKLPVRALSLVVAFVLTWVAGLTVAGFVTHRAVEFFPPKIGPDTTLQKEISNLNSQIKALAEAQVTYRTQIFAAQQKSMEDLVTIRRFMSSGETEAKANIERYAEMLKGEDTKIMVSIEDLKKRVAALDAKL
jgi:hypothetical protein